MTVNLQNLQVFRMLRKEHSWNLAIGVTWDLRIWKLGPTFFVQALQSIYVSNDEEKHLVRFTEAPKHWLLVNEN